MKIQFITSNASKVNLANQRLAKYGIEVEQKPLFLYEIQSADINEVSESKAEQAIRLTSQPFIIEDSGLFIDTLGGFPGTLLKPVFDGLGDELFLKLMEDRMDRRATVKGQLIYVDIKKGIKKTFEGNCSGNLTKKVKGTIRRGWKVERIFVPEGKKKTPAQMNEKEWEDFLENLMKNDHYEKFGRWFSRNST